MPRVRNTESEAVPVVKKPRAPRARAVVVDGVTSEPRKRAPRKTAPRAVSDTVPVAVAVSAPLRKAPTPIAAERKQSSRSTRMFIAVVILCILITGAGVVVGMYDRGAIDVVAVVNERNEKISRGEVRDASGQTVTMTVPVQTDTRPNGGLQIADPGAATNPPPVPEPTPVDTASSTTATSTESGTVSTTTDSTTEPTSAPTGDASALKPAL